MDEFTQVADVRSHLDYHFLKRTVDSYGIMKCHISSCAESCVGKRLCRRYCLFMQTSSLVVLKSTKNAYVF